MTTQQEHTMQSVNDIFDQYFNNQLKLAREWDRKQQARKQARAEHDANLHTCGYPPPAKIDGWYSAEQYNADSAAGLSTE
jgi:hypothetical protein